MYTAARLRKRDRGLEGAHRCSSTVIVIVPSLRRTPTGEHSQFKNFEITIYVLIAYLTQPRALHLNRRENIGRFVGTMHVLGCNLIAALARAAAGVKRIQ